MSLHVSLSTHHPTSLNLDVDVSGRTLRPIIHQQALLTSAMALRLLDQALFAQRAYNVPMDEVTFRPFGNQYRESSIGTKDLQGCTAIMIASRQGAIVAHISPRPTLYNPNDIGAGERHVQAKMNDVARYYDHWRAQGYFPRGAGTWVVCAVSNGEIVLSHQLSIMETSIRHMGLLASRGFYTVPLDRTSPGYGTVFIDGARDRPKVYIEDRLMEEVD